MRTVTPSLSAATALLALAFTSCSSGQPPMPASGPDVSSTTPRAQNAKSQSLVYITDLWLTTQAPIEAVGFPTGANGPLAPATTLGGGAVGLEFESDGIAVSTHQSLALDGQMSGGGAAVNVYPPGASGNTAPSAVYSCVGLGEAKALTFDKSGTLYAMNFNPPRLGSNSIFIFPPGAASGCPAGTRTIFGKRTQLFGNPGGIAVSKNHIYAVTGAVDQSAILVFPINANGNVRPSRIITGKKTTFQIPIGIAVDSKGEMLVADSYANSVDIFAANAKGDAAPIRTIEGPDSQLYLPQGVEVAKDGRIFVVNSSYNSNIQGDSIRVYAPDANGNAAPVQTIPGGNRYPVSEIGNPTALTLYEP